MKASHLSIRFCLLALLLGGQWYPAQVLGQSAEGSDPVAQDLPDGAVWRFGDHGRPARSNGFYRLAYSRDGRYLALRNQDNRVFVVDVHKRQSLWEFEGHEAWVNSLSFSPDGRHLVTAAGSGEKVKVWDNQTGKLAAQIDTTATQAYFNSIGSRIYVLGETHVETYSWPGTQLTNQLKWKTGNETAIGLSPDGRRVAMYRSLARNVYQTLVIDLETRTKIQLSGPPTQPRTVAFSQDRNWIAMNYRRDPRARLWDMRDPHNQKFTLGGHDDAVQSLSFSADNRFLLTTSWDDTAILWDVISQQPVQKRGGHTENVNASAFAPLRQQFATGASGRTDSSMILWDYTDRVRLDVSDEVKDFDEIWERLGHRDYVVAMTEVSRLVLESRQWLKQIRTQVDRETTISASGSVAELIKLLDAPSFEVREQATMQLIKIRIQADSQLRIALESAPSPEVRARLTRILKFQIERPPLDQVKQRRWMRLVFALELINSEQSQALLRSIAEGHKNIDISRDAAAARLRNDARKRLSLSSGPDAG